jgi:hypothetical protein
VLDGTSDKTPVGYNLQPSRLTKDQALSTGVQIGSQGPIQVRTTKSVSTAEELLLLEAMNEGTAYPEWQMHRGDIWEIRMHSFSLVIETYHGASVRGIAKCSADLMKDRRNHSDHYEVPPEESPIDWLVIQ